MGPWRFETKNILLCDVSDVIMTILATIPKTGRFGCCEVLIITTQTTLHQKKVALKEELYKLHANQLMDSASFRSLCIHKPVARVK